MSLTKEFSFICIGQAGGNIGSLFEAKGHDVLYINTSIEDLNTLPNAKHKYHITSAEGSAKSRDRAKGLIISNWDEIEVWISEAIQHPSIIFVVFSAAGGTGSGASPMLMDYLIQNNQDTTQIDAVTISDSDTTRIGAITILPDKGESLQAQANAYECLQELRQLEDAGPVFVIDNEGHKDRLALNSEFVDLFETILKLPDFADVRGSIDLADIKRALDSNRCATITRLPQAQSSTTDLLESFANSIFAPMENDGVVENILISMSTNIDMNEVESNIGEPLATFPGYNPEQTVCLLNGLSFPETRLDEIEKHVIEVNERRQALQAKKSPVQEKKLEVKFEPRKESKPKISKEDLFSKYFKKSYSVRNAE